MRLLKTIIKFHIPHIGELMLAFFYLKNTLLQITKGCLVFHTLI